MKILVTGGAGYIGSHTSLVLLEAGHDVVVLDDLSNGSIEAVRRVETLCGRHITFIEGDVRDRSALDQVFSDHKIDAVIHFAALKAVGESVRKPLEYFDVNVGGAICLLGAMKEHGVHQFVFSSSATIYGPENDIPYIETMSPGTASSPYGATKQITERVMQDVSESDPKFRGVTLRYFNPIGAHESGRIGEAPDGIPNNLMPFIAQVAVGQRKTLSVFGNDYATTDGSCERDYLHVMDLAEGHLAALEWLASDQDCTGIEAFNLGTGDPQSVLSMIKGFEAAAGVDIPYEIAPRRDGDLPAFWANADKAAKELGWTAIRSLNQMMEDTWRWQSANPRGYDDKGV